MQIKGQYAEQQKTKKSKQESTAKGRSKGRIRGNRVLQMTEILFFPFSTASARGKVEMPNRVIAEALRQSMGRTLLSNGLCTNGV